MSIRKIKQNLAAVYRQRRLEADLLGAERRAAVRAAYPELNRLEIALSEAGAALLKAMTGPDCADKAALIQAAEARQKQRAAERLSFLDEHGIARDYDQPQWHCRHCRDEGFVNGKPCRCYEQAYLPQLRAYLNLDRFDGMTFAAWRSDLFSDQASQTGVSPRAFMEALKKRMELYVREFQPGPEANLLFIGATGTGKTFLLGCLANALEDRGQLVLYLSAPRLLEEIAQYRKLKQSFSPDPDRLEEASALYELILHVPCLIIDDLGTEDVPAGTRLSEWLQLLNFRSDKATLISTNLNWTALQAMYDERLLSRLLGLFTNINFLGDDIRLKARYAPLAKEAEDNV